MTTTLTDLHPAPEGTKWELTVIDSNAGDYQARLVSRKKWEVLGHTIIPGNMSKHLAHKRTAELIRQIGNTID